MKHLGLFVVLGIAASAAAGIVHAGDAGGRITFTGRVFNETCNPDLPSSGMSGSKSCSARGLVHAVYMEQTDAVTGGSGIAMLDYFADRPDGGRKAMVTRQYR